ncbi:hypothetical protein HPB48_018622 [Haemaphysalis longicornis]|uniref:Ionotropic glutamate receptor C-terminal domain-containing protein n=1 Tax=Haemaphysalis longicornis TaxID=44386 RepID=A0A9J6GEA4_HAELO|nr:hypothetical protein HPB48_018622 [Haemaphysalis longicornis]
MTITIDRSTVARFGPAVVNTGFTILSSASPAHFDAFSYILAFDREVWLLLFMFLAVLSLLMAVREGLRTPSRRCPRRHVHMSQRLLLAVWLVAVVVLTNSFASLLKSNRAVNNFRPEVDSIEDIAERPHLTPITTSGTYYETFDKNSKSEAVKKVWALSRRRNSVLPMPEAFSDATLTQVVSRRAVLMANLDSLLLHMANYCERRNVRTFILGRQPIEETQLGYAFSKRLPEPYFRRIFTRFRWIMESGLMTKWLDEGTGNWRSCIQSMDTSVHSLSVDDVLPFFLIWAVWCAFACCAFLGELACARTEHRQSREMRLTAKLVTQKSGHASHEMIPHVQGECRYLVVPLFWDRFVGSKHCCIA